MHFAHDRHNITNCSSWKYEKHFDLGIDFSGFQKFIELSFVLQLSLVRVSVMKP
jgi:hypothetical protein